MGRRAEDVAGGCLPNKRWTLLPFFRPLGSSPSRVNLVRVLDLFCSDLTSRLGLGRPCGQGEEGVCEITSDKLSPAPRLSRFGTVYEKRDSSTPKKKSLPIYRMNYFWVIFRFTTNKSEFCLFYAIHFFTLFETIGCKKKNERFS